MWVLPDIRRHCPVRTLAVEYLIPRLVLPDTAVAPESSLIWLAVKLLILWSIASSDDFGRSTIGFRITWT